MQTEKHSETRPVAKITMLKRALRDEDTGGRVPRRLVRCLAGRRIKAA